MAAGAQERALPGSEDAAARGDHGVLLDHTRHCETLWDEADGHYALASFSFAVVLGNAVLLELGEYDAGSVPASGASSTLQERTLRSIARFAAANRWVNSQGTWGGRRLLGQHVRGLTPAAAAKLMWDDLDGDTTHTNVDKMIKGSMRTTSMSLRGIGEDPKSPLGWDP